MTNFRIIFIALTACLVTAWGATYAPAKYGFPQLQEVPIARVLENLEKLAAKSPKDSRIRLNIARVHAMAYSQKVETCKVGVKDETYFPWDHIIASYLPMKATKATDEAAALKAAQAHLEKAIIFHKEAIALDNTYLPAKLGLAWCLEQAKKTDEAIPIHRDVVQEGWRNEYDLAGLKHGKSIMLEAADYLLPLLDKDKDKMEIALLEERVAKMKQLKKRLSPIVIPLRDGLIAQDMVDSKARVRFDVDGFGAQSEWSWFTKDAGILVFDPLKKRNITSGIQWFGNITFWMFWDNGYQALQALDDNGDGMISGKELDGLAVWTDANGDGISQPHEFKTLSELGIVSISCKYEIDLSHADHIPFSRSGVTFANGTTRPTFDVYLHKH